MVFFNINIIMTGLRQQLFTAAPGLDRPPGVSEYIVLCLGVFLGNIAMGICGFGTAIIHLSVWVLAQAVGYNAGEPQRRAPAFAWHSRCFWHLRSYAGKTRAGVADMGDASRQAPISFLVQQASNASGTLEVLCMQAL